MVEILTNILKNSYILCRVYFYSMRIFIKKMVCKVQITIMNFIQVALNMQISFIPKQPFHSILDAMSPPSGFIVITSALWPCHFFWTTSTEIFPLCVFPLHSPAREVFGARCAFLKELYLLFHSFLPFSASLSVWNWWVKISSS